MTRSAFAALRLRSRAGPAFTFSSSFPNSVRVYLFTNAWAHTSVIVDTAIPISNGTRREIPGAPYRSVRATALEATGSEWAPNDVMSQPISGLVEDRVKWLDEHFQGDGQSRLLRMTIYCFT